MNKKLLIIGCPRSGTGYACKLLRALGLDIGHEVWGKHGMSCWWAIFDTYRPGVWYWPLDRDLQEFLDKYPKPLSYENCIVLHQTRYPLKVIRSLAYPHPVQPRAWRYVFHHIPGSMDDPILLCAMRAWYYLNLEAEKKALVTYPVEMLDPDGLCTASIPKGKAYNTNTADRDTPEYTWDDLHAQDPELTKRIRELAARYGYKETT